MNVIISGTFSNFSYPVAVYASSGLASMRWEVPPSKLVLDWASSDPSFSGGNFSLQSKVEPLDTFPPSISTPLGNLKLYGEPIPLSREVNVEAVFQLLSDGQEAIVLDTWWWICIPSTWPPMNVRCQRSITWNCRTRNVEWAQSYFTASFFIC